MSDEITGNESPEEIAGLFADLIRDGLEAAEAPLLLVDVTEGFQPYLTVRLRNGAEWQLTPVRSSWPEDGTSTQFADLDESDEG